MGLRRILHTESDKGKSEQRKNKAVVYSLIISCKACGLDLRKWMEDILLKITLYQVENRELAEFLPNHWASSAPTQFKESPTIVNFDQLGPTCPQLGRIGNNLVQII
jgi:hypothetical protein